MKKAIKILFVLAALFWLLVLFSLCSCSKHMATSITSNTHTDQVRDSTVVTQVFHNDTIQLPGDTIRISYPVTVNCPDGAIPVFKPLQVEQKGQRAAVSASIDKHGTLQIESDCSELEQVLLVKDTRIEHQRTIIDSLSQVSITTVPVKYIPVLYKWAMGFSVSLLMAVVAYFGFKLLKKYSLWTKLLALVV